MLFLLIAFTVMAFIYGYVGIRIIPSLGLEKSWQTILWILVLLMSTLPLAGPLLRFQGVENRLTDIISWIGYTSLGFFVLTLVVVVARDLGWTIWATGSKLLSHFPGFGTGETTDPSRRQFMITTMNLGIVSLTGGLSAYGYFRARSKPAVVNIDVPLKNLSPELEGLRIVQISDLHVGPTIKRDFVQIVVDQVQELKPDLVALTGDLVDGSVNWLSNDVEPLSQLKPYYGKYFITGNHEYYSGVEHWLDKTGELGFVNLLNEHRVLNINGAKLTLAGVNDAEAERVLPAHASNPEKALHGAPTDSLKILLAHQPSAIYSAQRLGVDLQLSGHTHGGQFKPFNLAVAQAFEYVSGLHNHKGTMLYVNTGTGYWGPPLRLGMPNEITVLRLTKA